MPESRPLSTALLSSTAGLGRLRGHDPSLHRHPPAAVVLQQEEVRHAQSQEELSRASTAALPEKSRCFPDSKGCLKCSLFSLCPWPPSPVSWPALTRRRGPGPGGRESHTNRNAVGSSLEPRGPSGAPLRCRGVSCWQRELPQRSGRGQSETA